MRVLFFWGGGLSPVPDFIQGQKIRIFTGFFNNKDKNGKSKTIVLISDYYFVSPRNLVAVAWPQASHELNPAVVDELTGRL